MKTFLLILIFVIPLVAQNDSTLVDHLENVIKVSKKKDYKAACSLIAYNGMNPERKLRSSLNPNSKEEIESAERIVKKIKAYSDISDSYTVLKKATVSQNDFEFTVVTVGFKSGKQQLEIQFRFVKNKDKYLLVAID